MGFIHMRNLTCNEALAMLGVFQINTTFTQSLVRNMLSPGMSYCHRQSCHLAMKRNRILQHNRISHLTSIHTSETCCDQCQKSPQYLACKLSLQTASNLKKFPCSESSYALLTKVGDKNCSRKFQRFIVLHVFFSHFYLPVISDTLILYLPLK